MTETSLVVRPLIAAAFSGLIAASVMPADAAKRQSPAPQPIVERSASGTIIQPTTTIIPDGTGHARVIVIPRRRSYLDTGTEARSAIASSMITFRGPAAIRVGPTGGSAGTIKGTATIHCRGVTARRSTRRIRADFSRPQSISSFRLEQWSSVLTPA
jgi:hypothetical protein